MSLNAWFKLGCLMAALAVSLGAFGAHGLDKYCVEKYPASETYTTVGFKVPLAWKRVQDFKTGAEYQMYHALGLIALGMMGASKKPRMQQVAGWLFLVGIVGFSGSLYALTLTGIKAFGAVAPIGGTAYILAWVALAYSACGCGAACPTKSTAENP